MKKLLLLSAVVLTLFSCAKNDPVAEATQNGINDQVKARVEALGFSSDEMFETEGGYIVEGDIFLSKEDLNTVIPGIQSLVVGESEQYHTTNLVTGLPRNISVRLNTSGMTTSQRNALSAAIDAAIARYNAEGLQLTFSRVTSGGNIVIKKAPGGAGYIASAGFPSGGNPYGTINFNVAYTVWNANTLTSVIAHEIGHCIGFRHTDYMDRSYSCGGAFFNEGASSVGAVHIPGTPTGPDPNSWMLACIGNGINRPFNNNDVTALNYLY
jgi:hypothetical protein